MTNLLIILLALSWLGCDNRESIVTVTTINNKDKSENSVAMSVCTPKHSYVFYGIASEDTSVAKNVLSGVEIRVDILPFGFSYFDTTDSFGLYGIEYPCPSIPIQQQYVITATHCLGNTEQVGPILLGFCEPIHNSFNF